MIKVIKIDSYEETKKAFLDKEIPFGAFHFCSAAFDGDNVIGECFYEYKNDSVVIKDIFPKNDLMLVDGILRSVFFVASNNGIEKSFFEKDELSPIFKKLGFLINEEEKSLKLKKIFETCEGCKGNC